MNTFEREIQGQPTMTRAEAAQATPPRVKYWNGKPCERGHRAYRYVSSGNCTQCANRYRQQFDTHRKKRADEIREMRRTRQGLVPYEIWVHPLDFEALMTLADALNYARGAIVGPDGHALIEPVS